MIFPFKKLISNIKVIIRSGADKICYRNKNMKLGVSYSVFDGEELLLASIKSIRESVDYINVVYQFVSWFGNPHPNPHFYKYLLELKEQGVIDELIEYKVNLNLPAHKNELTKRRLGLKHIIKNGCNYFLLMDADEFYISEDIEKAKKHIVENNITHSFVPQSSYGYIPTLKHKVQYSCFVPFITKIKKFFNLKPEKKSPCLVDYTRQFAAYPGNKFYVYNNINMHHMTYIRKDLNFKFKNSSCEILHNANYDIYSKNQYFEVEDIFEVEKHLKDFEKIISNYTNENQ